MYTPCVFAMCGLCCGQLWVRHMICGQTCDGLYHFTFYLIVLYSEIDQIHLSSEAQCVSHHLPQVDCHSLCKILNDSNADCAYCMKQPNLKCLSNAQESTVSGRPLMIGEGGVHGADFHKQFFFWRPSE